MADQQLHFVMVPLMAQGHMIPAMDIAKLFARRGITVTFIATPLNALRLRPSMDGVERSGLPVHLVQLEFPCTEVGLPDGWESGDTLQSLDQFAAFFRACALLKAPLLEHLRNQQRDPPPTCIISDFSHPWTRDVAIKLGIPRFAFHGMCCFSLLCTSNIRVHGMHERIAGEDDPFLVPHLPPGSLGIEVTKAQVPGFFFYLPELRKRVLEAEAAADGVLVNSFDALEQIYVDGYREATGLKVWTIGPVSLCNENSSDLAARGNRTSIDQDECLKWLDSRRPRSVVYVSFGSLSRTTPLQLREIGLALEASGHPFIWVIKPGNDKDEVERWLSEDGLEERTSQRGLIIKGWAPQAMILSHPAVGGFVTHCGWNSTLEGISAGVPMVTWPQFADQFLDERLVVEVLRVGVGVGIRAPAKVTGEECREFVRKEEIELAVREIMDGGEAGEGRRKRAAELADLARKAMDGGSSHLNITLFIEHVVDLTTSSSKANEVVEGSYDTE